MTIHILLHKLGPTDVTMKGTLFITEKSLRLSGARFKIREIPVFCLRNSCDCERNMFILVCICNLTSEQFRIKNLWEVLTFLPFFQLRAGNLCQISRGGKELSYIVVALGFQIATLCRREISIC